MICNVPFVGGKKQEVWWLGSIIGMGAEMPPNGAFEEGAL